MSRKGERRLFVIICHVKWQDNDPRGIDLFTGRKGLAFRLLLSREVGLNMSLPFLEEPPQRVIVGSGCSVASLGYFMGEQGG